MNEIVVQQYTSEQTQLIKNTVAKGATDSELALFMQVCKRTQLDPFTRQIHFVKRKQRQPDGSYKEIGTIQTGIDGYRTIAERSGGLAGIDDPVFDSEDKPQPKKATVTVYRIVAGINCKFTASARWSEYAPTYKGEVMWNKMPYLMLGKCAEALALRKAFPNDLSGVYTKEEMEQADTPEDNVQVKVVESEVKLIESKPVKSMFDQCADFCRSCTVIDDLKKSIERLATSVKYTEEEKATLKNMFVDRIAELTPAVTATETVVMPKTT